MKIIVAPDSFKGTLTADEVAQAIEEGIREVAPQAQIIKIPVADGGEGTVQALVKASGGYFVHKVVKDPLGESIDAQYGFFPDEKTAVIEVAAASGIQCIAREKLNPLLTTTYGTGELIRDALDKGASTIIVGLGGSATNDGGAGVAQALGVHLLDEKGVELGFGGEELLRLYSLDCSELDTRLQHANIILACDVQNPLVGKQGATTIFGPQKGATPSMVDILDEALKHYAHVIEKQYEKRVANVQGSGAAGGLAATFLAFTQAQVQSGIEVVINATGLIRQAHDAQLCITGEGAIDGQTSFGKAPIGIAQAVKKVSPECSVVALAGKIGDGFESLFDKGIDAVFGITPGVISEDIARDMAYVNVKRTAENVVRFYMSLKS